MGKTQNLPTPACQGSTGCGNTSWRGTLHSPPLQGGVGGAYILPFGPGRPGCCKPHSVTTRKSYKIQTLQKSRLDVQESPQDGSKTAKKPKRTPKDPRMDPKLAPKPSNISNILLYDDCLKYTEIPMQNTHSPHAEYGCLSLSAS